MLVKPWLVFEEQNKPVANDQYKKISLQGKYQIYQSKELLSKRFLVKEIQLYKLKHKFKFTDYETIFSIKHNHVLNVESIYSKTITLSINIKEFWSIFGNLPATKIYLVCRAPPPTLLDQIETQKILNKNFPEDYLW